MPKIQAKRPHDNETNLALRRTSDNFVRKPKHAIIKEYTQDGFYYGFIAGTGVTIVGLPAAAVIEAGVRGQISYKTVKLLNVFMLPVTLVGMIVGTLTSCIGGGVGNIVGRIKARKVRD